MTFIKKIRLHIPKLHPLTWVLIAVTVAVAIALLASPASSASANQCSSCHGTKYNQQLDIVEGNSQNKIPNTLQVDQIQTVTVVIQNINNALRYNQFSSVTLTLGSQNGHFSVTTPTYNVGTLSTGTATATWQITGTSAGSDALVISASATNTHNNLKFSDSYSPSPSLTVAAAATSTPTPAPTASPTPIPTTAPTPTPTSNPDPTATLLPSTTPTASPAPNPTVPNQTPTPTTLTPTTNPTQNPDLTPQPNQTTNLTNTSIFSTQQPTPLPAPILVDKIRQDVKLGSMQNSMGKLLIVAPLGTLISWETSTQEITLSPNGATQPLIVNLKYSSTNDSNALSANSLAVNWDAIGGTAPLKATIEYASSNTPGTWTTIAENILGTGSYTWTLPETENNYVKMQIKVSDSSPQAQNTSAIADINVARDPQAATAIWSISIYPSYIQALQLLAAVFAGVLYVKKMKAKRASLPTIKTKVNGGLKK